MSPYFGPAGWQKNDDVVSPRPAINQPPVSVDQGTITSLDGTDLQYDVADVDGLFLGDGTLLDDRALADDGNVYDTVQAAINAASSWVLVGPGTFLENVVVNTPGLNLNGFGWDTIIDGGGSRAVSVETGQQDARVTLQNFAARTDTGSGAHAIAPVNNQDNCTARAIKILESGQAGIRFFGSQTLIEGCRVLNADEVGIIAIQGPGTSNYNIIRGNVVGVEGGASSGDSGIAVAASRGVIANNTVIGPGGDGIEWGGTRAVVSGNVVRSPTRSGIDGSNTLYGVALGNIVEDPGDVGILVNSPRTTVIANTIWEATSFGVTTGGASAIIAFNILRTIGDNGIEANGGARQQVFGNNLSDISGIGIRVPYDAPVILGNYLRGIAAGNAAVAAGGERSTIGRNVILGPDTGIDLNGVNQLVSDNMINNAGTAIDTAGATTPTTTDNVIT